MQNIARIALGLGAAALVASGGSAFTQGLTVAPGDGETVGYGSATVTGATVQNIDYNTNTTNSSVLTDITFVITGDVTDHTTSGQEHNYDIKMALSGTTSPSDCPNSGRTYSAVTSSTTVVCLTTATVASVQSVHLTVTPK